mgnify:CR=1 FL=1
MSVYKPAKSRFWQFDFVLNGARFHGSTGQTSRRAAEVVERQRRLEAATGALGSVAALTIDQAALRYWQEVGISRGDAKDVERRLERLVAILGKTTTLGKIDQAAVAVAIERRRGQILVRSKQEDAREYLPSNATVNRDVIETLRPIMKRARTHWTGRGALHGLPEIDWRELRLREPRGLSRAYSDEERAAWEAACPDELKAALRLLLTNGLRFGELFFHPDQLDPSPDAPTLTLQKGRKRDVILHVPLRRDHARDLAALAGRARAADLPHLWFYERKAGREVKLVPYTRSQVEHRLSQAADAAGIAGGRRIHGARHHAASAILRRSRNLKAVQAMLGHASIQSSQRYAHVLNDDLRGYIEDDLPRNSPEAEAPEQPISDEKSVG